MENSENKYSFDTAILKALIEQGPSFVMKLLRLGMNEAMKVEVVSRVFRKNSLFQRRF